MSFWRPGAQDWSPAAINMPLAPGDVLFAGPAGNVEVQIGPRAFVRAAYGAQLGLDNQEPDFVQLRLVAGYAAVDLRELQPATWWSWTRLARRSPWIAPATTTRRSGPRPRCSGPIAAAPRP
ncbi:MAG TPA: hypothetical protein VEH31_44880 [Streptosporangiaceae bacterium]|nr:hypothetical protein [Streptosporangiaceae bacterium]